MSQQLIKGIGGTVETYFLGTQPASCTATLYTGDGGLKLTASATVDSVSTTLSSTAAKGATTLALASATGVVVGRRYLVGTASASQPLEVVKVRDLTASTATLWGPTMAQHLSGAAFKGAKVTLTVPAANADTLWWDGYCDFNPTDGSDVQTEAVDCVLRKIPANLIDETDVQRVFPKAQKILDAELDMPAALREARDEFLRMFGGKNRAHCALGVDHFRRPAALTFWILRRYSLGEAYAPEIDLMEKERDVLIQKLESQIPFDNDQDGTTTGRNDGGFTVIKLGRA